MKIPFKRIKQEAHLTDASRIVLYSVEEVFGILSQLEYSRNLYRINKDGDVIWRVAETTKAYPQCFESFYWGEDGELIAYNFDCWEYVVNLETGTIKRHAFLK